MTCEWPVGLREQTGLLGAYQLLEKYAVSRAYSRSKRNKQADRPEFSLPGHLHRLLFSCLWNPTACGNTDFSWHPSLQVDTPPRLGLLSLHNCMSQFLRVNLFLYTHPVGLLLWRALMHDVRMSLSRVDPWPLLGTRPVLKRSTITPSSKHTGLAILQGSSSVCS